VFSLMQGTFHAYYTVALAPGIAALVGIGGRELWRRRSSTGGRTALAVVGAGTAAWAFVLLGRTPDVLPWLRWVVVAGGVVAVFLAVVAWRRVGVVLLLAVLLTGALGPAAYAVQTAGTAHAGSIPLAGPVVAGAGPGGGRMIRGGPGGGGPADRAGGPVLVTNGPGGTGDADDVDADLVALLRDAGTRWAAAAVGAQSAGNLQLASGEPVIALGGFSGGDPAPTLAEFQGFVAAGEIHYLVAGGGMGGGPGRSGAPEEITAWVSATFPSTTVGGRTVYDLTSPLS
jgi:4-amino-4-deoxy-L-arabinose transferase-like glycosyltransferase